MEQKIWTGKHQKTQDRKLRLDEIALHAVDHFQGCLFEQKQHSLENREKKRSHLREWRGIDRSLKNVVSASTLTTAGSGTATTAWSRSPSVPVPPGALSPTAARARQRPRADATHGDTALPICWYLQHSSLCCRTLFGYQGAFLLALQTCRCHLHSLHTTCSAC